MDAAPSIIDALDHKKIFRDHFKGGAKSWAAWRAFLSSLFALPLDDDQLALFQHHTARQTAPARPYTEAYLICGRRAGKSRVLALLAVYIACFRDFSPYLSPGEIATIPIIAADRRQARTIFRYVLGLIDNTPALAAMKGDETTESVIVNKNVMIEIHTASYRAVRGYTLGSLLIDECAFLRSEETSANPDQEIIAAVRPGLSSIPGSMLLIGSSPYAKRGALYSAFRQHWGKDDSRVLVWRGTTQEMNPSINPDVIAQAVEDDAARANAEYFAQFRDDIAAFVTREVVEACTVPDRYELPRISTNRYHAYVDPSGGSADSFTLAIAHMEKAIGVLDCIREVKPPFSPEATVQDFCVLLKSYGITKVRGDRYAGEWPREQFRKGGIQYELSEQTASELYQALLPKLNSRQVELLDLPRLTKQLCDLERRTARSGRDSISHPPGQHDDIANSVAGCLQMAAIRPPMRISQEALAAASRPASSTKWFYG